MSTIEGQGRAQQGATHVLPDSVDRFLEAGGSTIACRGWRRGLRLLVAPAVVMAPMWPAHLPVEGTQLLLHHVWGAKSKTGGTGHWRRRNAPARQGFCHVDWVCTSHVG